MTAAINIARLDYLLTLYGLSRDALCKRISIGLKNPIRESDIFAEEIKLSHLAKIDRVFEKGIHYYLDPSAPPQNKEASVFFRKTQFRSDLNFGSRKVVNYYESLSKQIQGLAKLSDLKIKRKLRVYPIETDPQVLAMQLRDEVYPKYIKDKKEFLQRFIDKLSEKNIFVFEFVEHAAKREKANIDGFFIKPNFIVLKRQKYLKREIFSLAHELGHYLINKEEIEEITSEVTDENLQSSAVETWCNEFAFQLIAGSYGRVIDADLSKAEAQNDFHHDFIEKITRETHLSFLAIYTRMRFKNKLSYTDYRKIQAHTAARIQAAEEEEKRREEKLYSGFWSG